MLVCYRQDVIDLSPKAVVILAIRMFSSLGCFVKRECLTCDRCRI